MRAKLIEKDNKPQWKHKSYKEVDILEVKKKFFDRTEEIDVSDTEDTVQINKELENEPTKI